MYILDVILMSMIWRQEKMKMSGCLGQVDDTQRRGVVWKCWKVTLLPF